MSAIVVAGDTSGSVTLQAPAVSGTTVITLPATSGTMALSGGAGSFTTLAASGVATFSAGSAAAPAITTSGDTNTGIFFPAADTVAFGEGGSEVMRIDSSAYFLYGKTTSDLATAGIRFDPSGGGINVCNTNSGTQYPIAFYRAGTGSAIGYVSSAASSVTYSTTSDYRLKENVAPMTGALNTVALLKPVTYTWKLDGSAGQGFIAHELQAVVPDCVVGEKDDVNEDGSIKPQGIDTSFLVATLTAAIQEQQALIENLTIRLAALENK
jgi:hypothetical protein